MQRLVSTELNYDTLGMMLRIRKVVTYKVIDVIF